MLIKTLECNDFMVDKLRYTQIDLSINVIKRTIFFIFSKAILDFGFAFGYILAFLWGAIRMGHNTLTFGGMIAFLQLVNKIQGPARSLTKIIPSFVSVLIATERLIELEEPL
jgi:ABC-type bacteriocin/lantibiotic exporter with double-glycine peptidase domain